MTSSLVGCSSAWLAVPQTDLYPETFPCMEMKGIFNRMHIGRLEPEGRKRVIKEITSFPSQERKELLGLFESFFTRFRFSYEMVDLMRHVRSYQSSDEKREVADVMEKVFRKELDGHVVRCFLDVLNTIPTGQRKEMVDLAMPLLENLVWIDKATVLQLLWLMQPEERKDTVNLIAPLLSAIPHQRRDLVSSDKVFLIQAILSFPTSEREEAVAFLKEINIPLRSAHSLLFYIANLLPIDRASCIELSPPWLKQVDSVGEQIVLLALFCSLPHQLRPEASNLAEVLSDGMNPDEAAEIISRCFKNYADVKWRFIRQFVCQIGDMQAWASSQEVQKEVIKWVLKKATDKDMENFLKTFQSKMLYEG